MARVKARVYLLLLLGVMVGFMLSNLIQNVALSKISSAKTSREAAMKSVDYKDIPRARTVNLEEQTEETLGIQIGGEYEYDKHDVSLKKNNNNNAAGTAAANNKRAEGGGKDEDGLEKDLKEGIDEEEDNSKKLQRNEQYREANWQGRTVQDFHVPEGPVDKLSDELASRKPLMIAIITSVQQLMSQTIAIHGTWAKNAHHVMYFTGDVQTMPHLPHGMEVIQLEGIDDNQASWEIKEFAVIKYLIKRYLEDIDWFLIIGDDVFVNPDSLERKLSEFNASFQVYMGHSEEASHKCSNGPGVVYSRGLLTRLESYLPQCQGEQFTIGQCIVQRGIHCTKAKETHELFYADHKQVVETNALFKSTQLSRALTVYPVRYPKFMYRLYSYFLEVSYNSSSERAKSLSEEIHETHPFVPAHLRSSFKSVAHHKDEKMESTSPPTHATPPPGSPNIVIRPRHTPKNKFELNYWEYFNQTRLMSISHEQPSRGIIGGIREEARYALTKAIYVANQGLPATQRLVFEKLENGYHRVDPMRGSEYVLDFVFRKNSDRNVRVRKRVSILRPFHDVTVPVDSHNHHGRVNFVVTLSGLSNRLEQFLANYEKNIIQSGEDASLTIVLFDGPDAPRVHSLVDKYVSRYPSARISVVDTQGEFARGVGLHVGAGQFEDDQLLFFVDVDLEISPDFLQRCRLNTIQGKQVYFPVFFKLYNLDFVHKYFQGNLSQVLSRHNGHWAHYSFGMVCIYTADYRKSKGFDTKMKGWGEEDVDFLNRVMSQGLEIFRAPDPGLIHLWHRKVCNQNGVVNSDAYKHCLQSKAENLADRIELAQYVFQSELNQGNVL